MESGEPAPEGMEGLSEEEIRARVEEQIAKVRVQDLLLESVVGILNLAARRIAKEDERDLDQARVGIEAVRAVVDLLEPEPAAAVREALAELQMLYAREASGGSDASAADPAQAPPDPAPAPPPSGPGLWTPPGSSG
jgi:hypothetical protein